MRGNHTCTCQGTYISVCNNTSKRHLEFNRYELDKSPAWIWNKYSYYIGSQYGGDWAHFSPTLSWQGSVSRTAPPFFSWDILSFMLNLALSAIYISQRIIISDLHIKSDNPNGFCSITSFKACKGGPDPTISLRQALVQFEARVSYFHQVCTTVFDNL